MWFLELRSVAESCVVWRSVSACFCVFLRVSACFCVFRVSVFLSDSECF